MKSKQATITWLLATTAAITLAPVHRAHAQTTPAAATPPPANSVGELVVTAQRRAQRLQDVPLSVTAATAQMLANANVSSTSDLAMVTPGLRMDDDGVFARPVIRGITTYLPAPNIDANIATYVDGVYQQQRLSGFYTLPDVQEIEVLKGPQGTLFGRNATGGAILINSLNPNLTQMTGKITVGGGNFGDYYGKGYISIPIVQDKLAASLAVYAEHTDGWTRNILTNTTHSPIDSYFLRGKIRFDPWEGADFVLTAFYSNVSDYQSLLYTNLNGNTIFRAPPFSLPSSEIASKPWTYASDIAPYMKPISESVSLRGTIKVGPGTLTTTTGYVYDSTKLLDDVDASIIPYSTVFFPKENATVASQEFVYATDKLGRFQDTSGLFFYYNQVNFLPLDSNNYLVAIWTVDKDYSFGAFTDGTFDITDRLSIEGGVRFSWEKRQAYATIGGTLFGETLTQAQTQPPIPLLGQHIWTSVTPRVSILYKATDQTNLYFTYSEGFKSGAFNTVSLQAASVNPETVDAFEIGAKSNFSRNLTLNLAAFYYDYKNLQVSAIFQANGVISSILENAAASRIYGVEVNGSWNATEDLGFDFGATYLNAHYTSFPNASLLLPNFPAGTGNFVPQCPPSNVCNISGGVMESSPTFTADLTARYAKDTPVGHFSAAATVYYSTDVSYDVGDRIIQPAYATLNAFVAWRPVGSNVEIKLWGKNLSNAAIIASTTIQNTADAVIYGTPRTYGIEASYKF